MNAAERVAKMLLEALIPGGRMVYRDDQSDGVCDFALHYPDGQVAEVEVTASVDRSALETHAAIGNARRGGRNVKATLCTKPWVVHPTTGANINYLRDNVDRYLATVEGAGIEHFFSSRDRGTHPGIERIFVDLGVSSGDVIPALQPGVIAIALPISGGATGADLVTQAVEHEASKADNVRKLSAGGGTEAHLFVFIDVLNAVVWIPLAYLTPPLRGPALPENMTHAWVAGPASSGEGYSVWRASNGSTWQNLGVVHPESSGSDPHAV